MPFEVEELCSRAMSAAMLAHKTGLEETADAIVDIISLIQSAGMVPGDEVEQLAQFFSR